MRLTNAIRGEIEAAVMRDVPDDRPKIIRNLKYKVLSFFEEMLPISVRQAYSDHPEYLETRNVGIHACPDGVNHWMTSIDKIYEHVEVPYYLYDYDELVRKEKWFSDTIDQLNKMSTKRAKARKEVQDALKSVTTAKRLKEVYPDIAKYLPEDSAGKALAVPMNLPNLKATGWPDETRKQDADAA